MPCMTTDYVSSTDPPEPFLRRIAEAGFSHVHWCHQWDTAYLYGEEEVESLRALLSELGLRVLDLHGLVLDPLYYVDAASGRVPLPVGEKQGDGRAGEKRQDAASTGHAAREQGLAVALNRVRMTARLGSDTLILHPPRPEGRDCAALCEAARPFLEGVLAVARPLGVRVALENMTRPGVWDCIEWFLARYDAQTVGLCYDSGHGNLLPGSLDWLERFRGRLFSVHLHDNDGSADQHRLPFTGAVDWERLAGILARSSYDRPLSLESNTRLDRSQPVLGEETWLREAFAAAQRLQAMVEARRGR